MGIGALDYKKGGESLEINGIIQDYYVYAGENVNAGDFVEFVQGVARKEMVESSDTVIMESANAAKKSIHSVLLTSNTVFIAYNNNDGYLRGIVCTIEGASITPGTSVTIKSSSYADTGVSIAKLSNTKVFVTYCDDTQGHLNAAICTIDGNVITVAATKPQISAGTYAGDIASAVALSSTKVFVAHSYGSSSGKKLRGVVCTISGTTITVGTDTTLSDTTYTGNVISVVKLTNTSVFIAHGYSSSDYLYGMVCIIDGTTITAGTDKKIIGTSDTGLRISAVAINSTSVFIAHSKNGYIGGIVCTIDGTTITAGTDVTLFTSAGNSLERTPSVALLSGNRVFVSCGAPTADYYLQGIVVLVDGTTITPGELTLLDATDSAGYNTSTIVMEEDKVFIAHSKTAKYYLYANLFSADNMTIYNGMPITTYETQVRTAKSTPCNGLAKTGGIGGTSSGHNEQVSIYVPNI